MTANRTSLSGRKQLLFSLLVVTGFFVALELVLWVVGVEPVPASKDPFVGFSTSLPLFADTTTPDGEQVLRTAKNKLSWFNASQFRRKKAATTYRIFSLGGSTTYGRPYTDNLSFSGWLRELLPLADPATQWEVINAGGISYASYRIAVLMEELIAYEPDLFIIYAGQNEFLEHRTYSSLMDAPQPVLTLASWASRTRLYTAGARAIERISGGRASEAAVVAPEVEALLDRAVGPAAYHRDDRQRERILQHYRYNLNRMIELARSAGAGVLLVTPASNLKDCSPFKSESGREMTAEEERSLSELASRAAEAYDARDWELAAELYGGLTAIDPRYAEFQYRLGVSLYERGEFASARTALERALEEDVCTLRAPRQIAQIVREVGAAASVPVVDFETMVRSQSPEGIPGNGQFLDHVHPHTEGYGSLARAIIEQMAGSGLLRLSESWTDARLAEARLRVLANLDHRAYGESLLNLGKVYAWAGKLDEAERFARQARTYLGDESEVSGVLGHAALARRDLDEAIPLLEKAVREQPDTAYLRLDLGTALYLQGRFDEAIRHFEATLKIEPSSAADAHNNIGLAREAMGDIPGAVDEFNQSLAANPRHVDAMANLGTTLLAIGRTGEALARLRRVLELEPGDPKAWFNLGAALEATGDHAGAAAQFREAIRLEPSYAEAYNGLGLNLISLGDITAATAALKKAVSLAPSVPEARDHLGIALMLAKDWNAALQEFETAIRLREDWPPPLAHAAQLLATAPEPVSDPERAVTLAEQAVTLTGSRDLATLQILEEAYTAAGRTTDAARAASLVREIEANRPGDTEDQR